MAKSDQDALPHGPSNDGTALAARAQRLAHEANNSLMPIRLGLDLLKKKVDDPALVRSLQNIELGVTRLSRLIEELLHLDPEDPEVR